MVIGVIGGSGLYQLEQGEPDGISIETPFGTPSGPYYKKVFGENTAYFLPRHGRNHTLLPSEINYRANIYGFKALKAQAILSVSAVGSLKKNIAPGDLILPEQYIDLTRNRQSTFFGGGVVAHAHFADPACATLRAHIASTAKKLGIKFHLGGTYVCMEGPQFSTRAESNWYRSWNLPKGAVDVIGMTALPEAKLAREAGLCYQTIAMATDFDCWNEENSDVSVDAIIAVLHKNVGNSLKLITTLCSNSVPACSSHCREQMTHAVMTPKEAWPAHRRAELEVILN